MPLAPITLSNTNLGAMKHGFFTRQGGISEGLYQGLQCGYGAKTDSHAAITENRRRVAAWFEQPAANLVTLPQVHSADVIILTQDTDLDKEYPPGDALVTNQPGCILGVLTADCVPVLFADPQAKIIGAAHAGWKGALGGILTKTVTEMKKLGATPSYITALIGPAISQKNYQVDAAFRMKFTAQSADNSSYFKEDSDPEITPKDQMRYRFDLIGYVNDQLSANGINHIHHCHRCTYAEPDNFYSNRRALHQNERDYGRGISAIMIQA